MTAPRAALQNLIGYQFADAALLDEALTHPSLTGASAYNYQRLEFLGDAVLGAAIAAVLYAQFPGALEGELAKRQASLVRGSTLTKLATQLQLGEAARFAKGERESGGAQTASNLEDLLEALIGAIYLDGGFNVAAKVVERIWSDVIANPPGTLQDNKTRLQELAQGQSMPVPHYEEMGRTGPAHAPEFTIKVTIESGESATGTGASRRKAEQVAAAALLQQLIV